MYLLFDFDGTIADTYPLTTKIFLELSPKYHLLPQTIEEIASARDLTAKQIFAKSGLSLLQLPFFLKDSQNIMTSRIGSVKPFPEFVTVLQTLHLAGHHFGVVTSNSAENVNLFLTQNNLLELFDFVHSEKNIWGKAAAFKHVIQAHHLNQANLFYLGDESRDIEAAHQAGIKIIAVGWGFNSPKLLKTFQPDFLIENPIELLNIVK